MKELSWVKKQGEFADQKKKNLRRQTHLPLKQKLDWFAEAYESFEQKIKESEPVFRKKRMEEKIEFENRILSLNFLKRQVAATKWSYRSGEQTEPYIRRCNNNNLTPPKNSSEPCISRSLVVVCFYLLQRLMQGLFILLLRLMQGLAKFFKLTTERTRKNTEKS